MWRSVSGVKMTSTKDHSGLRAPCRDLMRLSTASPVVCYNLLYNSQTQGIPAIARKTSVVHKQPIIKPEHC